MPQMIFSLTVGISGRKSRTTSKIKLKQNGELYNQKETGFQEIIPLGPIGTIYMMIILSK